MREQLNPAVTEVMPGLYEPDVLVDTGAWRAVTSRLADDMGRDGFDLQVASAALRANDPTEPLPVVEKAVTVEESADVAPTECAADGSDDDLAYGRHTMFDKDHNVVISSSPVDFAKYKLDEYDQKLAKPATSALRGEMAARPTRAPAEPEALVKRSMAERLRARCRRIGSAAVAATMAVGLLSPATAPVENQTPAAISARNIVPPSPSLLAEAVQQSMATSPQVKRRTEAHKVALPGRAEVIAQNQAPTPGQTPAAGQAPGQSPNQAPGTADAPDAGQGQTQNQAPLAPPPAGAEAGQTPPAGSQPEAKPHAPAEANLPKADKWVCEPNVVSAMQFLMGQGATMQGAAGLLANAKAESNIIPDRKQGAGDQRTTRMTPGVGFGLFQWTTGDRQNNLARYVKNLPAPDNSLTSLNAQLGFAITELKQRGLWDELTRANGANARQLAIDLMIKFEAPADHAPNGRNAHIRGGFADALMKYYPSC